MVGFITISIPRHVWDWVKEVCATTGCTENDVILASLIFTHAILEGERDDVC